MVKRKEVNRSVEVWQPAVLRLTAFTVTPDPLVTEDWWEMIVGAPSETTIRQTKTQERLEEGTFLEGKLAGLEINRLAKWAVLRRRAIIAPLFPQEPILETGESYASHLEVDINSSANRKEELPSNQLEPLFTELSSLAKEIAENGDVE